MKIIGWLLSRCRDSVFFKWCKNLLQDDFSSSLFDRVYRVYRVYRDYKGYRVYRRYRGCMEYRG